MQNFKIAENNHSMAINYVQNETKSGKKSHTRKLDGTASEVLVNVIQSIVRT